VGRRHEEGVVPGPVHPHAAQVDRRGIDRAVEDDALLLELAHVRRRDPSPGRPRVVASRVITEAGPVTAELRRRRARLHRGAGTAANGEEAYKRKYRNKPAVHPEIVPERPYLLARGGLGEIQSLPPGRAARHRLRPGIAVAPISTEWTLPS